MDSHEHLDLLDMLPPDYHSESDEEKSKGQANQLQQNMENTRDEVTEEALPDNLIQSRITEPPINIVYNQYTYRRHVTRGRQGQVQRPRLSQQVIQLPCDVPDDFDPNEHYGHSHLEKNPKDFRILFGNIN